MIKDFLEFIGTTGIKYDLSRLDEAEPEIKNELKREIYAAVFSLEEGIRAYRQNDPVVLKAIEVMPEAIRFVRENR